MSKRWRGEWDYHGNKCPQNNSYLFGIITL